MRRTWGKPGLRPARLRRFIEPPARAEGRAQPDDQRLYVDLKGTFREGSRPPNADLFRVGALRLPPRTKSGRRAPTVYVLLGARAPHEHAKFLEREENDSRPGAEASASSNLSPQVKSGGGGECPGFRRHGHELRTWGGQRRQGKLRRHRRHAQYSVQQAGFLVLKGGRERALDCWSRPNYITKTPRTARLLMFPDYQASSWPRPSSPGVELLGH